MLNQTNSEFIEREQELRQLQTFLDDSLRGQGKVVFVIGEAGSGKTALVKEFVRRSQEKNSDLIVAIGDCNSQTGIGDPYLPFREVLGLLTGDVESKLAQGAISQENADRLKGFLNVSGEAILTLGPNLINLFVPGGGLVTRTATFIARKVGWIDRLKELTDVKEAEPVDIGLPQSYIFEQYTSVLLALSEKQPLVIILDDLQWADSASISLLFHLARRINTEKILIIGTYRPREVTLGRGGARHPLESVINELKRYFGDIFVDLDKIERSRRRKFVDALLDLGPNEFDVEFRDTLFQLTEGHPLFTVELIHSLKESGALIQGGNGNWVAAPSLNWDKIPTRVEGIIGERIGKLSDASHDVLSVASIEGQDFTAEVIGKVQSIEQRKIIRLLSDDLSKKHRLVSATGVERVGEHRLSLYRFLHNLFQKYLYDSLDDVEKVHLHEQVGNVLEEFYQESAGEISIQLARHFYEAGVTEKAVFYLIQAGDKALRSYAYDDVITHVSKGLELLNGLPETPERIQQRQLMKIFQGASLLQTKGFGAPEVGECYEEALSICDKIEESQQLFPILRTLYAYYLIRGDMGTTHELGEQLVSMAHDTSDPGLPLEAHHAIGATQFHMGQFVPAIDNLERSISLYDPQLHRYHCNLYGTDPAVSSMFYSGLALCNTGYPDRGLVRLREALTTAQELDNPSNIAYAYMGMALIHHHRGEVVETNECADSIIEIASKYGFPHWLAWGNVLRGWGLSMQGQLEGITQINQGINIHKAIGSKISLPTELGLLAEAYYEGGDNVAGLAAIDEALSEVDTRGEAWWEAQLHRLKGEILLSNSEDSQAESCFRKAIGVARNQAAKYFELQASTCFANLLRNQNRKDEAKEILSGIFSSCSEGYGTSVYKSAKSEMDACI